MLDEIYLVRHAHPLYPGGKRLCMGRKLDLPLSPLGREQARAVAPRLRALGVGAVFSSPLRRALETARIVAEPGLSLTAEDGLSEVSGGDWDGLTFEEIERRFPGYFDKRLSEDKRVPPGGETDADALCRAMDALGRAAKSADGAAAIVTHAGIGRILLASLAGMPLNQKKSIFLPYAGVVLLRRHGEQWRVESWSVDCGPVRQPAKDA